MRILLRLSAAPLRQRFAHLKSEVEAVALDAASDALADELLRAREGEGLDAPLARARHARRHFVGADDSESVARELGTPSEAPAPWLVPVLPGARAPMRAAALARVRDLVAVHAGKRKGAAARALSRPRRRA